MPSRCTIFDSKLNVYNFSFKLYTIPIVMIHIIFFVAIYYDMIYCTMKVNYNRLSKNELILHLEKKKMKIITFITFLSFRNT